MAEEWYNNVNPMQVGALALPFRDNSVMRTLLNKSMRTLNIVAWNDGLEWLPDTLYTMYDTSIHTRMKQHHTYALQKDYNSEADKHELNVCRDILSRYSNRVEDMLRHLSPTLAVYVDTDMKTYAISHGAGVTINSLETEDDNDRGLLETIFIHGFEAFKGKLERSISYLHNLGYLHDDLNSRNILIKPAGDDYYVIFVDFELSEKLDGEDYYETKREKGQLIDAYHIDWFATLIANDYAHDPIWTGVDDNDSFLYRNQYEYDS